MNDALSFLHAFFGNNYFVLVTYVLGLISKTILFSIIAIKNYIRKIKHHPSLFLLLTLFSAVIIDIGALCVLSDRIGIPLVSQHLIILLNRLAWAFVIVQYHAMAFLLVTLITNNYKKALRQSCMLVFISSCFMLFFFIFSLASGYLLENAHMQFYEGLMQHICSAYLLLILMPGTLYRTLSQLVSTSIPIIIRKQYHTLVSLIIIPYLTCDFLAMNPLRIKFFLFVIQNKAFAGFSALILACLLYFCIRRLSSIHFFGTSYSAASVFNKPKFNEQFKLLLNRLDKAAHGHQIQSIVREFLSSRLRIDDHLVYCFLRFEKTENDDIHPKLFEHILDHPLMDTIEQYLTRNQSELFHFIKQQKCLIFDNLEFDNFYAKKDFLDNTIQFLASFHCAIFLPIIQKEDLLGYIIIHNDVRHKELYSRADKDMFIIFAHYLGTTIMNMQRKKIEMLIKNNHALSDIIYEKDQQIIHLKESVRIFLYPHQMQKVGVLIYKNREFLSGDTHINDLLMLDLNKDSGHDTTKACKQLVQLASHSRAIQSTIIKSGNGTSLCASAIPHHEAKHISLVLTLPHISDMVGAHTIDASTMEEWEYFLYLETTKNGTFINEFLPGNSKEIMKYKTILLKKILSKRPLFLQCHDDDLLMVAHAIHSVHQRHELKIIDAATETECRLILFGINPLYGVAEEPLLSALHKGTLVIKNAHTLSAEIQEQLAVFMQCGYFNRLHSRIKISSDVHIIMTSHVNIHTTSTFYTSTIQTIFKDQDVQIPTPLTLEEADLLECIEGYSTQAIVNSPPGATLKLSEYNKRKIIANRPLSLFDLKRHILMLLKNKGKIQKEQEGSDPIVFDPAFTMVDQTLAQAARMGKNALKDIHMLTILWHKFNKNQNQMARFLGVHRSSINRRLKEFNLI